MTINVVLVDDHAIVREGLRLLLESNDTIKVVGEAANGRMALNLVKKLNPHVIVMDVVMPELNGIDATVSICQSDVVSHVVILSMHATSEHIFRALKAGAKGYVLKDSVGQELIRAVRTVHAGGRYLSDKIFETVIDDFIYSRQVAAPKSPLEQLSRREREILQMVSEGKSSANIAEVLSLSPKTVETYRSRMMNKVGIHDLPGLIKFAIKHGLTPL